MDNQDSLVVRAVCLLHHLPYQQQLQLKKTNHEELVSRLHRVSGQSGPVRSVRPVLPSPDTEEYRARDRFSLGLDPAGRLEVGFHLGGRANGVTTVSPQAVPIIRPAHKAVAALYQQFLATSPLAASWYQGSGAGWRPGYWSELMVRSTSTGQLLVKVGLAPGEEPEPGLATQEHARLCDQLAGAGLGVASIWLGGTAGPGRINKLLFGPEELEDELGGVRMLVGPDTFTQVNPGATTLLLRAVEAAVRPGPHRTLLDLCCGAGMFSLYLGGQFRGCLGLDREDTGPATRAASLNLANNCRYQTGSIAMLAPGLVRELGQVGAAVSAVLNPGRQGVEQSAVVALRRLPLLDTLVYISCQPEDQRVLANMALLVAQDRKGTPTRLSSKPFRLVDSFAIDMFPHTPHCEHIFVFRR